MVFVPFSRDHRYSGGFILLVFRSANNAGSSVPGTKEHGSDPFPRDHVVFVESYMPGLKGAAGECLGCRKESGCRDSTFPAQSSRIGDVILKVHVLDIMRPESRSLDPIDNGKLRLDPREGVTMPSSGSSFEHGSPDPVNGGNVGRIGRGKAATSTIRRQGSMTLRTAEPLPSSGPLVNGHELRSSDPIYGGNGGRLRRGKSLALEKETFRAACVQKLPSNGFSRKATPNQKNSAWAEIVRQ